LGVPLELIKMKNKSVLCFLSGMKEFDRPFKSIVILILLILSGLGGSAFGQDLLILKSGKELKVSIIEENESIVKYREYENPAGPLYQVAKDKVASIKYKNGQPQKEVKQETVASAAAVPALQGTEYQQLTAKRRYVMQNGKALSNKAVKTIMENNPEALRYYVSGKNLLRASNGCLYATILSSFIASSAINNTDNDEDRKKAATTGLVISGSLFLAAIITVSAGKSKVKKSVQIYNSSLNKPVSYKLDFGLQENGIGLALRF
jgi:hypothetical protein